MFKKLIEKVKTYFTRKNKVIIGIDMGEEGGDHTVENLITINQEAKEGEEIKEAFIKIEIVKEAGRKEIFKEAKSLQDELDRINRENTNNWRKMHGLPMKRKINKK